MSTTKPLPLFKRIKKRSALPPSPFFRPLARSPHQRSMARAEFILTSLTLLISLFVAFFSLKVPAVEVVIKKKGSLTKKVNLPQEREIKCKTSIKSSYYPQAAFFASSGKPNGEPLPYDSDELSPETFEESNTIQLDSYTSSTNKMQKLSDQTSQQHLTQRQRNVSKSFIKARTQYKKKNYVETLNILETEILQQYPKNKMALSLKAQSLGKLGSFQESLYLADYILSTNPNDQIAMGIKGRALLGLGRINEALAVTERALTLVPNDALTLGIKSKILILLERFEEALDTANRKIEIAPNDEYGYGLKAKALIGLQQDNEALETLEHRLAKKPFDRVALALKEKVLSRMNNPPLEPSK